MTPKLHQQVQLLVLLLAASILVGCAQLKEVITPDFSSKWSATFTELTQTRNKATAAVNAGAMSKTDGQRVLQMCDQVRSLLDESQKTKDRAKLDLAADTLKSTKAFVEERSKAPPVQSKPSTKKEA